MLVSLGQRASDHKRKVLLHVNDVHHQFTFHLQCKDLPESAKIFRTVTWLLHMLNQCSAIYVEHHTCSFCRHITGRVEINGRNRNVQDSDIIDPLYCCNTNLTTVYHLPYRNISAMVSIYSELTSKI